MGTSAPSQAKGGCGWPTPRITHAHSCIVWCVILKLLSVQWGTSNKSVIISNPQKELMNISVIWSSVTPGIVQNRDSEFFHDSNVLERGIQPPHEPFMLCFISDSLFLAKHMTSSSLHHYAHYLEHQRHATRKPVLLIYVSIKDNPAWRRPSGMPTELIATASQCLYWE